MVLGIIALVFLPLGCCCGVGWLVVVPLGIAAIALGFSARSKATASQGLLGGGGKALAGIVTGGTAIGIAAVLFVLELIFRVGSGTFFNVFVTPSP
jgi:hypothetical protein